VATARHQAHEDKNTGLCAGEADQGRRPETTTGVEALLRRLAEMEQEEMELLMRERIEAEREGRLHELTR
jgi:hypothetical protein